MYYHLEKVFSNICDPRIISDFPRPTFPDKIHTHKKHDQKAGERNTAHSTLVSVQHHACQCASNFNTVSGACPHFMLWSLYWHDVVSHVTVQQSYCGSVKMADVCWSAKHIYLGALKCSGSLDVCILIKIYLFKLCE